MKSVMSEIVRLRHYISSKAVGAFIAALIVIFSLVMGSLIVVSLAISLSCTSEPVHSELLLGDLDGNSVVNRYDLDLLIDYVTAFEVPPVPEAADVNGDGSVNVADIVFLANRIGGM